MNLNSLEKAFSEITCPVCNEGSLGPVLRCDLDPKDCVAKAQCSQCSSEFHVKDCGNLESVAAMTVTCEIENRKCFIVPAK